MGGDDQLAALRGFPKQFRQTGDDVGVQAKLRLLDADEGRRSRVAENGQQAEVAERAVGQASSRVS